MKFGLAPPEDIQTLDELEAYLKDFEVHMRKLDTPIQGGPRRHHHIPQFYLKRFANKHKRMIRMSLPAHPPPSRNPTHITNLAVMKDFYTVRTAKGDSAIIEKLLGIWDHDASECFQPAHRQGGLACVHQSEAANVLLVWVVVRAITVLPSQHRSSN